MEKGAGLHEGWPSLSRQVTFCPHPLSLFRKRTDPLLLSWPGLPCPPEMDPQSRSPGSSASSLSLMEEKGLLGAPKAWTCITRGLP